VSHHYTDLIALFERCFFTLYNTRVIKGGDEPIYLPAGQHVSYHQIVFAHGYYSSALHEIAHWCLAGEARRQLEDYGYWYCPDGRDQEQQAAFEQAEVKPQAIEWAFCLSVGLSFHVSVDNLDGFQSDRASFQYRVAKQGLRYLQQGFPPRAQTFISELQSFYQQPRLSADAFQALLVKECR
jgi:hypothetical protein